MHERSGAVTRSRVPVYFNCAVFKTNNLACADLYFSDDWQKFECLITYFKGLRGNSQPSNKAQGYTFRFGASNVLVLYSPGMENLPRFGFVVGHFSLTSEKDRITIISNELGVFMKSVGDGVSYPSSKNFIEWLLSENFARVLFEESLELSYVPDLPTSVSSKACIAEITRETVLNLYAVADAWHGTAFFQNKNTNDTNTFNLATNAGDEDHLSSAKPVNISHGQSRNWVTHLPCS